MPAPLSRRRLLGLGGALAVTVAAGQVLDRIGLDDSMSASGGWSGFLAASVARGRD